MPLVSYNKPLATTAFLTLRILERNNTDPNQAYCEQMALMYKTKVKDQKGICIQDKLLHLFTETMWQLNFISLNR